MLSFVKIVAFLLGHPVVLLIRMLWKTFGLNILLYEKQTQSINSKYLCNDWYKNSYESKFWVVVLFPHIKAIYYLEELLFINRMSGPYREILSPRFWSTDLTSSVRAYKHEGLVFQGPAWAIRLINSLLYGENENISNFPREFADSSPKSRN